MKALTNDGFPRCTDGRAGCFANDMGRCICLNDTTFRSGKCPFYKTEEEYERAAGREPQRRRIQK